MLIETAFINEWEKREPHDLAKGFYFHIENVFTFEEYQLDELYQELQKEKRMGLFSSITGSDRTFT